MAATAAILATAPGTSGRPRDQRRSVLTLARSSLIPPALATAGLLVPLAALDRRMQATGGPGIIPFELAGPQRSPRILRTWGDDGRRAARASLLLDFPFLVAYTWLNVRLTAQTRSCAPPRLADMVTAIQLVAGACDAIENATLLGVVARDGDDRLSALARRSAQAKFAGLLAGGLYTARYLFGGRR